MKDDMGLGDNLEKNDDQWVWISASDLMSGTMIIFFLLMLYYMVVTQVNKGHSDAEVKQAAAAATNLQTENRNLIAELGNLQSKVESLQAAATSPGKQAQLIVEQQNLMTANDKLKQQSEELQQTVQSLQQKLQGAQVNADNVKEVAVLYDQKRADLYHELLREFNSDLPKWNAEIHEDLTIRFNEPNVLFAVGSAEIRDRFKTILNDFFPRYMKTIAQDKYRSDIAEVRIEGHTSSFWNLENPAPPQIAYLNNMDLSYQRTRSVLHYVLALNDVQGELPWLRKHLTANGLSSAKLIYNADGSENYAYSQRVEFKVRTDAESKLAKILQLSN